jgi:hypothetical protein
LLSERQISRGESGDQDTDGDASAGAGAGEDDARLRVGARDLLAGLVEKPPDGHCCVGVRGCAKPIP